ncbi:tyrosine-type recombinase/integrase [Actinoplanes sp. NPDC049118]|uniref:tyrosine-type recombinase/integrase n=1 Tax=Actinoplanes sp. NPDC049118 TaxID=3155769 RepID=UPI0033D2B093
MLRAHLRRQRAHYLLTGRTWRASGYVFTRPDGLPFHPNHFTRRLRFLTDLCGLPPVRLHDLRHGAASLAHAAGADLKTVQGQLGHASIVLTADTYTSVLPAAQHKAAEVTARLILTTARNAHARMTAKNRRRRPGPPPRLAQTSTTPPRANNAAGGKSAGQGASTRQRDTQMRTKRSKRQRVTNKRPRTTPDSRTAGNHRSAGWAAGDSNPEPKD